MARAAARRVFLRFYISALWAVGLELLLVIVQSEIQTIFLELICVALRDSGRWTRIVMLDATVVSNCEVSRVSAQLTEEYDVLCPFCCKRATSCS